MVCFYVIWSVDLLPWNDFPGANPIVSIRIVLQLLRGEIEENVEGEELNPNMKSLVPNGGLETDHDFRNLEGEFVGVRIDRVI